MIAEQGIWTQTKGLCYVQHMTDTEELKTRVHDFWQAHPCGTKFAREEVGTRGFFEAVERHRYQTEWHIPEVVDFRRWRDKDVLEVGCGVGTDAINFAREGARYTGVDLTSASIDLVRRRFDFEGLEANLRVADAEALPFGDDSFDLIYSHGVLHHTPDTQRAIDQVHRVLRPGGTAMVMLYHKNSYNYRVNIMILRRLGVRVLAFDWGPAFVHKLAGEDQNALRELQRDDLVSRACHLREPACSRVHARRGGLDVRWISRGKNRDTFLEQAMDSLVWACHAARSRTNFSAHHGLASLDYRAKVNEQ